jgi:hypothetical protein
MGHGYFAVVGFGIIVHPDNFLNKSKPPKEVLAEIEKKYCRMLNFDYRPFYERRFDNRGSKIFITVGRKVIHQDTRGNAGSFREINDNLKLTPDEELLLQQVKIDLVGGEEVDIKLGIFCYEDE